MPKGMSKAYGSAMKPKIKTKKKKKK